MIPRALLATAIAAGWMAAASSARQQDAPDLVPIHVAVDGGDGRLTADDFEVAIDGAVVPIVRFAAPPATLSVVLILDKTASMESYGDIDDEIGRSFAPALNAGDRARVGGLASRLVLAPAFSSNRGQVVSAGRSAVSFRREDKFGASPIWDAVDQAVAQLEGEPGLRALVLITDGRATGNTKGITPVADRAVYAGVVIHVLTEGRSMIIRQSQTVAARIRPSLPLEQLARATGGTIFPPDPQPLTTFPDPGPIIRKFMDDLHAMYTLGISPRGASGSLHRVEVRMKRPGLTARARSAFRTR